MATAGPGIGRLLCRVANAGAVLLFVGMPLLLGSFLGLIASLMLIYLLALRTLGEEEMLLNELDGYIEYKQKVRYRFLPFVW